MHRGKYLQLKLHPGLTFREVYMYEVETQQDNSEYKHFWSHFQGARLKIVGVHA